MRNITRLFALTVLLCVGTTCAFALGNNRALNQLMTSPRIESWPGQPSYPQPTPPGYPGQPIPPSYPGQPTPPSYPGQPIPPSYPGQPPQDGYESSDQLYNNGRRAFVQGNFYSAIQTLRSFIDRYPVEYRAGEANYMVAESYRRLGDYYNAISFFRRVAVQFPNMNDAHRAAYFVGYCLVKVNDFYSAINEYRNFINRYPQSTLVPDAWYVLGQAYERVNDINNAIYSYQKVVYGYTHSTYYRQALERLNYLQGYIGQPGVPSYPPEYTPPSQPIPPSYPGSSNQLSDYELYSRGHSKMISGNYNNAITYFDELLKLYPSSNYAHEAAFWKAKARYEQRRHLEAINEFERFINVYPTSSNIPEAVYTLAQIQMEYGRISTANRTYLSRAVNGFAWFQQNYPRNRYAPEALYQAGLCSELLADYSTARYYFQQVINLYPYSATAFKAKDKINSYRH